MLAGSVFRRVWAKARKEVLSERDFKTPMGKRVYDLRHTCLTTWLNKGIPPAQVAEWAGNSVTVLHAIYARCIAGQLPQAPRRGRRPSASGGMTSGLGPRTAGSRPLSRVWAEP